MADKELRRLSRSELLEMLIAQTEENSQLKIRLEQAEAQLRDRRIEIDKAGSLAEAAPQRCLSGGGGRGAAVSGKYPADQQPAGCHQPRYQGAVGKRGRPDPAGGRGVQPKSTRGCGCLLEAGRCQSVQTAGRPGSTAAIDSVRWRG